MANSNSSYFNKESQLLLSIGNSRLHWALLRKDILVETWNTPHLSHNLAHKIKNGFIPAKLLSSEIIQQNLIDPDVLIASVVPLQTEKWQNYTKSKVVKLSDIKLDNLYPTLGIDRALAAWGGGETYGYSCLIIDGGTALTFTGINKQKELIGGAILPGLKTQFLALQHRTPALPEVELPITLPPRWALNTKNAIASGIIYATIGGIYSYIQSWQQEYPNSNIIFTGGDGEILASYLCEQYPELKSTIICDRNLIFYGMKLILSV